jgi:glycosyltransferase involved in cell wall biosynthesis
MIKVFMLPTPAEARGDTTNSINAIVLHLQRRLPAYGVELVETRAEADLVVGHAGQTDGSQIDIAHVHGLYPTAYGNITTQWHWAANRHVVDNMLGARAITVPSQWVADLLRRDMHADPHVIGWAIDPHEWEPGNNQGYVLWNKTRTDGVCSPEPLIKLAAMTPDQRFLTTFGTGTPNIQTTDRVPFETMRAMVQGAAVYLATTKETFGIGTLEAMACGVPVLGFRHGATPDIVEHGVTGYLVAPGDYEGLKAGLDYCLKHRATLGANARQVALTYTWDRVAACFAEIYRNALRKRTGPKVSVVIPCYNYAQFLENAVNSVIDQQTTFDYEIIVVNDGSTDETKAVTKRLADQFFMDDRMAAGRYFGHVIHKDNGGVAEARNTGIRAAQGEYIVCLDADDMLGDPRFLQTLADALDNDPKLGIAFTGLRVMNGVGVFSDSNNPWPNGYNFDRQVQRHNQVPTCCMFRREAWQRAGGYRKKYTPAEDAELWLRIGALGYKGQQVTNEGWFIYRLHNASLSSTVRTGGKVEPDWVGDKPWAGNNQRPFASDGVTRFSWAVRNYDKPKVSVVIPVGPYHTELFREAVDSVESQSDPYWECIVVNDSGKPLDLTGMPFVKLIDTHGGHNASVARNMGIAAASAPFVAFLDADDVFDPLFLERTLRQYAIYGKYVYTDWYSLNKAGDLEYHKTPDFDPVKVFRQTSLHSINILIPKADLIKVGGFDESMGTWEDVDLFMKLAKAGLCGVRLPEPLVTYRYTSGQLRERGELIKHSLIEMLSTRYAAEMKLESIMCCGDTGPRIMPQILSDNPGETAAAGTVRVLYNGPTGRHEVIGLATKSRYGYRQGGETFYIYVEDYQAQPDIYQPIADINTNGATVDPGAPVLIKP